MNLLPAKTLIDFSDQRHSALGYKSDIVLYFLFDFLSFHSHVLMQLIEVVKLIEFGQDSEEQLLSIVRIRIDLFSYLLLDALLVLLTDLIKCLITEKTSIVVRLGLDFLHVLIVFVRFHQT